MSYYENNSFKNQQEPLLIEPLNTTAANSRRKSATFLKRFSALALSAVLFGGIAAGTFYGMNQWLPENSSTVQSNTAALTALTTYTATGGTSQSLDVTRVAASGLPSVVSVTNISVQEVERYFGRFGRNYQGPVQTTETVSCGSGILVHKSDAELFILTNYHVVQGATTLSVSFVNDEACEAQLCGYDEETDLAVIKVPIAHLTEDTLSQISVVSIGDSDELIVGKQVVAIGNALGYGQSVTTGIVSAVNRSIENSSTSTTYIQTDAAINPGNSGGALLNMDGELVGINTAKISSTGVEGMGYAIPITQAMERIESFMK